jgi:hypothetical protein
VATAAWMPARTSPRTRRTDALKETKSTCDGSKQRFEISHLSVIKSPCYTDLSVIARLRADMLSFGRNAFIHSSLYYLLLQHVDNETISALSGTSWLWTRCCCRAPQLNDASASSYVEVS